MPVAPLTGNPHAALVLLQALRRNGLRHLVLCPGSRSAPLAVAGWLLEGTSLRLHTALDERSAAFFALGLARAAVVPAGVLTTSGTAVANLLPAAVEADHGTIPLLLITADRPARLKGCGANQSVNQEAFLACRWVALGPPEGLAALDRRDLERLAVMLANSSPVRDWESFADPGGPHRTVVSFRGASGIDGSLSLACGLAEELGRLVLV